MIRIVFHFSIRVYHSTGISKKRPEKKIRQSFTSFRQTAEEVINKLTISRGKSTLDNYRTALRSFLDFAGKGVSLEEVSTQMTEGWQKWLRERGVSLNTVSCYMRSLRAIIRHSGQPTKAKTAFEGVFTGSTKTDKRSIPVQELRKLLQLQLQDGSSLRFARDIFLFCVYCLGMPFVDVAFLRKKQIADGYIEYQRHKTQQPIRIRLEPQMQRIINRYSVADSPYVFPILKKGTMKEYETARCRYNRCLHRLSDLAGISRRLTSYVARHSWASMAYSDNVDLPVISKALGHTNSKTTQVYISEIDDSRVDLANHKLLASLST